MPGEIAVDEIRGCLCRPIPKVREVSPEPSGECGATSGLPANSKYFFPGVNFFASGVVIIVKSTQNNTHCERNVIMIGLLFDEE